MQKVAFFLPLLNPLFHHSNLPKIFNWPCMHFQNSKYWEVKPSYFRFPDWKFKKNLPKMKNFNVM